MRKCITALLLLALGCLGLSAEAQTETITISDVITGPGICERFPNYNGQTYGDFTKMQFDTKAVYSAHCWVGKTSEDTSIHFSQYRGFVTTDAGGTTVTKITITWAAGNKEGSSIYLFGKNTPYESPDDVYDENKSGKALTIINYTGNGEAQTVEYEISQGNGACKYIGLLPIWDEVALGEIRVSWEVEVPKVNYITALSDLTKLADDAYFQMEIPLTVVFSGDLYTYVYDGSTYSVIDKEALGFKDGDVIRAHWVGTYDVGGFLDEPKMVPQTVLYPSTEPGFVPRPKVLSTLAEINEYFTVANVNQYCTIRYVYISDNEAKASAIDPSSYRGVIVDDYTTVVDDYMSDATDEDEVKDEVEDEDEEEVEVNDKDKYIYISSFETGIKPVSDSDGIYDITGFIGRYVGEAYLSPIKFKQSTVDVVIGSNLVATFSSKYPLDFEGIDEVRAFKADDPKDNVVPFYRVFYKTPPATGLIVRADTRGTYQVPCKVNNASIGSTNFMKPAVEQTQVSPTEVDETTHETYTNYILARHNGVVAFHPIVAGSCFTLDAGKAYLSLPNRASTTMNALKMMVFDDEEPTGIEDVKCQASDADDAIYNLQGIKVDSTYRGIVIKNGVKVYNR